MQHRCLVAFPKHRINNLILNGFSEVAERRARRATGYTGRLSRKNVDALRFVVFGIPQH